MPLCPFTALSNPRHTADLHWLGPYTCLRCIAVCSHHCHTSLLTKQAGGQDVSKALYTVVIAAAPQQASNLCKLSDSIYAYTNNSMEIL